MPLPTTVTLAPPVAAMLLRTKLKLLLLPPMLPPLTVATSNDKPRLNVPEIDFNGVEEIARQMFEYPAPLVPRIFIDVDDTHPVDSLPVPPMRHRDEYRASPPIPTPLTVTELAPVGNKFTRPPAPLTTLTSVDIAAVIVPTLASPTDNTIDSISRPPVDDDELLPRIDESDVHDVA